jgi:thermitase
MDYYKQTAFVISLLGHLIFFSTPAKSQSEDWPIKMIDAPNAWRAAASGETRKIKVAIIDTGVDVHHPSIRNHLWTNMGETGIDKFGHSKANNGVDDDKNGYIDDVHGWNFGGGNRDLFDHQGHGTHIAGIIESANGRASRGIASETPGLNANSGFDARFDAGVNPNVELMILKYFDPKYSRKDTLISTIEAIRYAIKMKADIINYSAGGVQFSREEKQAIHEAEVKGILFVAASGNDSKDSDISGYYPADYGLSNILSVTAVDPDKVVLPSSNYGVKTVQIAAPGSDIISSLPGGTFGKMTGTSQATAFATGAAAFLMSHRPTLRDPREVIKILTRTGDESSTLNGKTRESRSLNAYRALAMKDRGVSSSDQQVDHLPDADPKLFSPGFDAN